MIHQVKRSLIMLETVWSMKVIYHFILQYNTIFVSLRSLHFLLRYCTFFENKPNLMFFSNNTIYYHLQLTILSFISTWYRKIYQLIEGSDNSHLAKFRIYVIKLHPTPLFLILTFCIHNHFILIESGSSLKY